MKHSRASVVAELERFGMSFGETRAQVVSNLGRPDSTVIGRSPNPFVDAADSVYYVHYAGLQVWLLRYAHNGHEAVAKIHFASTSRELPSGLKLRLTTYEVLQNLIGAPGAIDRMGDSTIANYRIAPTKRDEYVQFYFVRDTLRKIVWAFYVD